MYTSGWPKTQNRCCHSTTLPPLFGSKILVPKCRSNSTCASATVMTGRASSSSTLVISAVQVNSGMRMAVMPGARRFTMVAMKLMEAIREARPRICRPITQKSVPWPGVNWSEVRFS